MKKENTMNNYERHAREEFRAAGWTDENGNFNDEMQEAICNHVMKLLEVFDDEGHSGSSAPYAINLFEKLAMFKPLAPLTGEDWEWVNVAEQNGGPLWQNKRCGHVFKDNEGAYDINGIVFYDWYVNENGDRHKSYFTGKDSRVPVTFPYTPTTEYREYVDNG
jgi:hypothetical protein